MSKNKKTQNSLQAVAGSCKQISFLPEPDFNPKLPSKNTLVYQALRKLLRGEKFSHIDFLRETGSWRLAAYIENLKNDFGWPVQSYDADYAPLADKLSRQISVYYLEENIIQRFKVLIGGGVWL